MSNRSKSSLTSHLTTIPPATDFPTLTIPEAGRLGYHVSRAVAYRLARNGTIPTIKLSERGSVVPTALLRRSLGLDPDPATSDGSAPSVRPDSVPVRRAS